MCDLKMDDKAEEPLWVFIYPYGVTLACVCIHTCYRPLTIAFALLALNCDRRIEKQRVVDKAILQLAKYSNTHVGIQCLHK